MGTNRVCRQSINSIMHTHHHSHHVHHASKRLARPAPIPEGRVPDSTTPEPPSMVRRDGSTSATTCSGTHCNSTSSSLTTTLPVILAVVYVYRLGNTFRPSQTDAPLAFPSSVRSLCSFTFIDATSRNFAMKISTISTNPWTLGWAWQLQQLGELPVIPKCPK